ncbi:MAG TPA: archaetidylserine decarboxylase [Polyangia bacterium]
MAPKRALTGAIGWAAGLGIPSSLRAAVLTRFARLYGIDTREAEKPFDDYPRVDAYFTRRLGPASRPFEANADAVLSPADGTVVESGAAVDGHLLQAKGVLFDLEELVGDEAVAARLKGGAYLITYLSPKDYHRVHAPIAGAITGWRHIPGTLFPVNAKSVEREPGLFIRNERFVTLIEGEAGLAAVVMVAAVGVGHVTAAYDADVATHDRSFLRAKVRHKIYETRPKISQGDELATFHLGSTTIVVFEPGRVDLVPFVAGARTQMGETIGRVLPASADRMTRTA